MSAKINFNLRFTDHRMMVRVQIYFQFTLNSENRFRFNTGKYVPLKKEWQHLTREKLEILPELRYAVYDWDKSKNRLNKTASYSEKINHYIINLEKKPMI